MNQKLFIYYIRLIILVFPILISSVNAQNRKVEISETDKLQIILKVLSVYDWKASAYVEEIVYFSEINLPEYLLKNFPQKLGDFKILLKPDNEFTRDFNHKFARFSDVRPKKSLAFVTLTFYGGCGEVGAEYRLEKQKGKWIIKFSEPFAASC